MITKEKNKLNIRDYENNINKELKQLVDEYKIKVNDLEELIIKIKKKSMTNELFRQLFSIQTSDELIIELSNI